LTICSFNILVEMCYCYYLTKIFLQIYATRNCTIAADYTKTLWNIWVKLWKVGSIASKETYNEKDTKVSFTQILNKSYSYALHIHMLKMLQLPNTEIINHPFEILLKSTIFISFPYSVIVTFWACECVKHRNKICSISVWKTLLYLLHLIDYTHISISV
jgi:hypothetical protein